MTLTQDENEANQAPQSPPRIQRATAEAESSMTASEEVSLVSPEVRRFFPTTDDQAVLLNLRQASDETPSGNKEENDYKIPVRTSKGHFGETRMTSVSSPPPHGGPTIANPYFKSPSILRKTTQNRPAFLEAPSGMLVSPEQRARSEANRKRALQFLAEKQAKRVKAPPESPPPMRCRKCSQTAHERTLCIVWKHDGEIGDEEPEDSGRQQVRHYTCCGRVVPQPCSVGRHVVGAATDVPRKITCTCGLPAKLRRTQKNSRNCGRYFFCCGEPRQSACSFFAWADALLDLPPSIPKIASDGIKEWLFPYANPFDEPNLHTSVVDASARRRLIAAMLLREMILSLHGAASALYSRNVMTRFATNQLDLFPLTSAQVQQRFGSTDLTGLSAPTHEECAEILQEIMARNDVIRSTVDVTGEPTHLFINLMGLEIYLGV